FRLSPEVDLMIAYIKEQDIKPLQQAVMATGLVHKYENQSAAMPQTPDCWHCYWSIDITGSSSQSLASQLQAAVTQLCKDLNSHNQAQAVPNHKNQWTLDYTVGPRFWSPNDPVVLLSHLSPSDRYGQDGRLREDKRLLCPVVSNIAFPPDNLQADHRNDSSLLSQLEPLQQQLRQEIEPLLGPYYRSGGSGQAHPFLLEWQANLATVRPPAYRQHPDLPYQPDEIKDHWHLAEIDAELGEDKLPANAPERTISFTGNSLLLDYAGGVMDQAIAAYLINSLEEYFTRHKIAPADQKQHLRSHSGAVRHWLVNKRSEDDLEAIANDLKTMGSVHPTSLYGIRPSASVSFPLVTGINNFLDDYQSKLWTETGLKSKLSPLLIVAGTAASSNKVLPYLLGLSEADTTTFIGQVKARLTPSYDSSGDYSLLTPQRIAVILRYADALGYIAGERAGDADYRQNVLWRPLVMGLPDGGGLASAILSIVNRASQAQLSAIQLSDPATADILKAREIQPIESLSQLAALHHFNPQQMAQLLWHLEDSALDSLRDLQRTQFKGLDQQSHDWVDPRLVALDSWQTLINNPGLLTVTLNGFNNALLSKQTAWQLPVADPLGFAPYRAFSELTIKRLVGRQTLAPLPNSPFTPIRSGHFNLERLRLVDTFGQYHDLNTDLVRTTEQMRSSATLPICLPPRLVQPARLNVRWLDADPVQTRGRGDGETRGWGDAGTRGIAMPPKTSLTSNPEQQEWNSHPASSPICGWVLPNMLDARLMIYNQDGSALGSLDQTGQWRPKPGSHSIVIPEDIPNPHLRRMVVWLRDQAVADAGETFIPKFVDTLETALEYIDPDNFDQSPSLALFIGRPLALVRVALSLELQEPPAVEQSLTAFTQSLAEAKGKAQGSVKQTLGETAPKTQGFETVRFPVRLGEHHRFQDGVVGYWTQNPRGELSHTFYAPQSDHLPNDDQSDPIRVYRRQDGANNLWLALNDDPKTVSVLMDVRGSLHVTSAIVPTKELLIPTDQVLPALRAIEVTFLTAPLLTARDRLQINLPRLSGWQWSWVAREAEQWSTLTHTPRIERDLLFQAFPQGGLALWKALLSSGLLTALPGEPVQALYDAKQLGATLDLLFKDPASGSEVSKFGTKRQDLERFFQIQTQAIEPLTYEAKFRPQVLREGWLQLSPVKKLKIED
ncbi:MAG: hypothetical protein F6K47_34725, partial [Symploca sp. SIO2E6]|nr:hypothetical protein [Symploca sp. SIO2E6]